MPCWEGAEQGFQPRLPQGALAVRLRVAGWPSRIRVGLDAIRRAPGATGDFGQEKGKARHRLVKVTWEDG